MRREHHSDADKQAHMLAAAIMFRNNKESIPAGQNTINTLLLPQNSKLLEEVKVQSEQTECLGSFFQSAASKFVIGNTTVEDHLKNYLAIKIKGPHMGVLAEHAKKKLTEKEQKMSFPTANSMLELEEESQSKSLCNKLDDLPGNLLVRGESSSALIESQDFDVFNKVNMPDFQFEKYFKRADKVNPAHVSWETEPHDIYEPRHTTQASNDYSKEQFQPKDKKNFGIKYSFQVDERARNPFNRGLECFQSDSNVLMYKGSGRPDHTSDTVRNSPTLSKANLTTPSTIANLNSPLTMANHKSKTSKKDKDKHKQAGKKSKKDKDANAVYKNKKHILIDDNIFVDKDLKTMCKKHSATQHHCIQTRSNSRDPLRNPGELSPKITGIRSITKERPDSSSQHLKKKMRIRDRHEQPVPLKDNTNSVFIKKKKKKTADCIESLTEPSVINQLLFKSIRQTKDTNLQNSKPLLTLEQSYLTDDYHSKIFDTNPQTSPKYGAYKSKNMIINMVGDSNSKQKASRQFQTSSKKIKKSKATKKKQTLLSSKGLTHNPAQIQGDFALRKSLEKSMKMNALTLGKLAKKEEVIFDIQNRNPGFGRTIDTKSRENLRGKAVGIDEIPYYSQRSKTANKVGRTDKDKRRNSKKREETWSEIAKGMLAVQHPSINSPTKRRLYGKNSSSLLEKQS